MTTSQQAVLSGETILEAFRLGNVPDRSRVAEFISERSNDPETLATIEILFDMLETNRKSSYRTSFSHPLPAKLQIVSGSIGYHKYAEEDQDTRYRIQEVSVVDAVCKALPVIVERDGLKPATASFVKAVLEKANTVAWMQEPRSTMDDGFYAPGQSDREVNRLDLLVKSVGDGLAKLTEAQHEKPAFGTAFNNLTTAMAAISPATTVYALKKTLDKACSFTDISMNKKTGLRQLIGEKIVAIAEEALARDDFDLAYHAAVEITSTTGYAWEKGFDGLRSHATEIYKAANAKRWGTQLALPEMEIL